MKNFKLKTFLFVIVCSLLFTSSISYANNNPKVDKFVPSTGYKVKHNPLAEMMENSTKNTMQRNNRTKQQTTRPKTSNVNRDRINSYQNKTNQKKSQPQQYTQPKQFKNTSNWT